VCNSDQNNGEVYKITGAHIIQVNTRLQPNL